MYRYLLPFYAFDVRKLNIFIAYTEKNYIVKQYFYTYVGFKIKNITKYLFFDCPLENSFSNIYEIYIFFLFCIKYKYIYLYIIEFFKFCNFIIFIWLYTTNKNQCEL